MAVYRMYIYVLFGEHLVCNIDAENQTITGNPES
jgi:hypothetical protein